MTTQQSAAPQATTGEGEPRFRHRLPVQIRFNDVDRLGHVNNNAYFAYYDLGKEDYFVRVMRVDYERRTVTPVVASIRADFFHPIFQSDAIVVETRVARLGRKSFTLTQRAVQAETGRVMCQCDTVMVCYSVEQQASVPIPEAYRRAIEAYEEAPLSAHPDKD